MSARPPSHEVHLGNSLLRRLPDVLQLCGEDQGSLLLGDVNGRLRRLVATFDLGPENVLLRPTEWNLAAVALLDMFVCFSAFVDFMLPPTLSICVRRLSLGDARLSSSLNSPRASKYLGMLLLSYGTDLSQLHSHLLWTVEENLQGLADKWTAAKSQQ